ncbi:hypothetical protein HDU78_003699, partial [Chytriomyces hyalinus]
MHFSADLRDIAPVHVWATRARRLVTRVTADPVPCEMPAMVNSLSKERGQAAQFFGWSKFVLHEPVVMHLKSSNPKKDRDAGGGSSKSGFLWTVLGWKGGQECAILAYLPQIVIHAQMATCN